MKNKIVVIIEDATLSKAAHAYLEAFDTTLLGDIRSREGGWHARPFVVYSKKPYYTDDIYDVSIDSLMNRIKKQYNLEIILA